MATTRESARGRGQQAGLSLELIIATALEITEQPLTMQAVADRLGVNRKAINYHVSDRETLVTLVSTERFLRSLETADVGTADTWQGACRAFARGIWNNIVSTGELIDAVRLDGDLTLRLLQPAESILTLLLEAGFDIETAARGFSILITSTIAHAREHVASKIEATAPVGIQDHLWKMSQNDAFSAETTPHLMELMRSDFQPLDRQQLALALDLWVGGMEAVLARGGGVATPTRAVAPT